VKNAPAVTARRATNQIVLGPVQQVLAGAGTETATQTAAPAVRETQTEAPAAIVVAELNVRVATTPRIAPAEMATDHTRLAHRATGIDPILRAPLVTAIRVHPEVMVIALTRRALLVMVIARIRRAPRVMEIDRIRRALRGTAIRDRPAAVAIVPTLLVLLAMAIPVPVAMAMTAHVFPAATAIQVAGLLGAMAIRLVDRPGPAETDPIRHALLVTVRDQSVLVSIGLTVLARTDRIGRVPIVPMATSRVASGNRMGESVVRSARR